MNNKLDNISEELLECKSYITIYSLEDSSLQNIDAKPTEQSRFSGPVDKNPKSLSFTS